MKVKWPSASQRSRSATSDGRVPPATDRLGGQRVGQLAGAPDHGRPVLDDGRGRRAAPGRARPPGRPARPRPAPGRGGSTTRPACRAAALAGSSSVSTSASSPDSVRRTTTIGWITRCTSQPARTAAACTDSTRNGMSSVMISTTEAAAGVGARPVLGLLVPARVRAGAPGSAAPGAGASWPTAGANGPQRAAAERRRRASAPDRASVARTGRPDRSSRCPARAWLRSGSSHPAPMLVGGHARRLRPVSDDHRQDGVARPPYPGDCPSSHLRAARGPAPPTRSAPRPEVSRRGQMPR